MKMILFIKNWNFNIIIIFRILISVLYSEEKESDIIPEELQDCVVQLNDYFEGKRRAFDLKLNPSGTFFQKQVWNELQQIPFGKTISYLDLSKKLGDVKAIRAVANANGKNIKSCWRSAICEYKPTVMVEAIAIQAIIEPQ